MTRHFGGLRAFILFLAWDSGRSNYTVWDIANIWYCQVLLHPTYCSCVQYRNVRVNKSCLNTRQTFCEIQLTSVLRYTRRLLKSE